MNTGKSNPGRRNSKHRGLSGESVQSIGGCHPGWGELNEGTSRRR